MIDFKNGKIVTDLSDLEFIRLVMFRWAGYGEDEIDAILASISDDELSQTTLKHDGFLISENTYFNLPEEIVLVLVGNSRWILKDKDVFEMEAFVEDLNEDIE